MRGGGGVFPCRWDLSEVKGGRNITHIVDFLKRCLSVSLSDITKSIQIQTMDSQVVTLTGQIGACAQQ